MPNYDIAGCILPCYVATGNKCQLQEKKSQPDLPGADILSLRAFSCIVILRSEESGEEGRNNGPRTRCFCIVLCLNELQKVDVRGPLPVRGAGPSATAKLKNGDPQL